jgi:hypothetical protein
MRRRVKERTDSNLGKILRREAQPVRPEGAIARWTSAAQAPALTGPIAAPPPNPSDPATNRCAAKKEIWIASPRLAGTSVHGLKTTPKIHGQNGAE